ncbi:MAG TPA: S9 family peptidase, partial [Acetobacteraceae bacterium]
MPVPTDAWVQITAATSPSFSRDGTRIFHLRGAGLPQVWAMDLDGGNATQLSHHGEKVAMLRRSPADDRLIWGIDAGGDERQQFWIKEPDGEPRALTSALEVIHDFGAWSPDGARIAYAANDRDERIFDVCVMELATGATTRLLEGAGIMKATAWSPDGATLAVLHDHSSSDERLILL